MIIAMRFLLVASLIAATAAPAIAAPEGCAEDDAQTDKKQGKFHIEYINGKPVTVIDTVVSVCGKVPRPSVVYTSARGTDLPASISARKCRSASCTPARMPSPKAPSIGRAYAGIVRTASIISPATSASTGRKTPAISGGSSCQG